MIISSHNCKQLIIAESKLVSRNNNSNNYTDTITILFPRDINHYCVIIARKDQIK